MGAEHRLIVHAARCDGCGRCVAACARQWKGVDGSSPLGPETSRLAVRCRAKDVRVAVCRHCAQPPCVEVCPDEALHQDGSGRVVLDSKACIGCQACVTLCPFDAIFVAEEAPVAYKCNLCADISEPPCVKACPSGALVWQSPERGARQRRWSRSRLFWSSTGAPGGSPDGP